MYSKEEKSWTERRSQTNSYQENIDSKYSVEYE